MDGDPLLESSFSKSRGCASHEASTRRSSASFIVTNKKADGRGRRNRLEGGQAKPVRIREEQWVGGQMRKRFLVPGLQENVKQSRQRHKIRRGLHDSTDIFPATCICM
ncbi:hypothetical protein HPP92_006994 [Vanilla planifolia]|uniref:Uncharacterized protein n=1 Tax=Vanilla planifolia TaxID=51239 RepID=A0A835V5P6_VANPL|nr:hypothetical protein HPP92_007235 [Vanilla planifolia]KAG0490131.1 hypothetical protein HPP92_006994 [Vanilla planifolia]